MFWKQKNKCPITIEDKEWIENQLYWLNENIVNIKEQPTVLPTKKFFNWKFTGVEEDAKFVLDKIGDYCNVNTDEIYLDFYSEEAIELDRGTVTQQEPGTGSAGVYVQEKGKFSIFVEVQQLKRPNSLIATISHELSHYVLLGQNNFELVGEENEWITDLLAIAYGFGIFIGNSRFEFSQFQSGDGWGGWQYSIQGSLPHQIIAYAMAEIETKRTSNTPPWIELLRIDFRKDLIKSMEYITQQK
ncbi:MAG: hypothetical protein ACI9P5_003006 [Saprospiraceae bacterium]|jgi:hypothetical protein|tara:strand:+ start:943 stop:1674 length:732 start_codon:yes stop_codon:yes gene_type:complete